MLDILFKLIGKIVLDLYDCLRKYLGFKRFLEILAFASLTGLVMFFSFEKLFVYFYNQYRIITVQQSEEEVRISKAMDRAMQKCGKNSYSAWIRVDVTNINLVKLFFREARGFYNAMSEPGSIKHLNSKIYEEVHILDKDTFDLLKSYEEFRSYAILKDEAQIKNYELISKLFALLRLKTINMVYVSIVKKNDNLIWIFTLSKEYNTYNCSPAEELTNVSKYAKDIITN